MSENVKTTANISYIGCLIHNVHLATDLTEFKTQFIKEFHLEKLIKEDEDEITIYYKKGEKKNDVKESEDYKTMLEHFLEAKDSKDKVVYVETKKLPVYFEGEKSIEFEDEIRKVVERELRIAANNIKKCLTTNLSLSNSKKVRIETCKKCKNQIIGYLYKKIDPNEDSYYCELCSSAIETPLFKIN